jgi:hypothetical protein
MHLDSFWLIIERGLEVPVISETYIDIAKFTGRPHTILLQALENQCRKDLNLSSNLRGDYPR